MVFLGFSGYVGELALKAERSRQVWRMLLEGGGAWRKGEHFLGNQSQRKFLPDFSGTEGKGHKTGCREDTGLVQKWLQESTNPAKLTVPDVSGTEEKEQKAGCRGDPG